MIHVQKIRARDPAQTEYLGQKLGKSLHGGEVIELVSDLGGGKTTLTRGIAAGVGPADAVSSPTFTISNVYHGPEITIHHYDFYRLGELGLMSEELRETMTDPKVVVIMEWADEARSLLPAERTIHIELKLVAEDENARDIVISVGDDLKNLLTELEGK